jgi:hypothetical protein
MPVIARPFFSLTASLNKRYTDEQLRQEASKDCHPANHPGRHKTTI